MDDLLDERLRLRYHIPVPLTHHYSPVPDIVGVKTQLNRWYKQPTVETIRWDLQSQKNFLDQLQPYKTEGDGLPSCAQITAEGYGEGYGEVEARLLHCVLRHFKPRQVIEVGAGVSTFFMFNALRKNNHADDVDSELMCIEPYPRPKLKEFVRQNNIKLQAKAVQDVNLEIFRKLEKNDVLFIDSSHVSKIDSDVNFLYLEVLPNLQPGVVIHIHDIPFPYLTVTPDHPLFDYSLLWNEAALVKAFLMYNEAFKVLMCQSYLHHDCPAAIKRIVNSYDERQHFPASLWLAKVK